VYPNSGKKLPNGKECFDGRPGAEMAPMDFRDIEQKLTEKYDTSSSKHTAIKETDVMSYSQYPKVFEEYMDSKKQYGNLSVLDTRTFVEGMHVGQVSLLLYAVKCLCFFDGSLWYRKSMWNWRRERLCLSN
jgi:pyruvate carboxylase